MNDHQDSVASEEEYPPLPILETKPNRRTAVKAAAATLGLAAFGKAIWPLTTIPENVSIDEFLQQHYKELTEEDKQKVFSRLEAETKEECQISNLEPITQQVLRLMKLIDLIGGNYGNAKNRE